MLSHVHKMTSISDDSGGRVVRRERKKVSVYSEIWAYYHAPEPYFFFWWETYWLYYASIIGYSPSDKMQLGQNSY